VTRLARRTARREWRRTTLVAALVMVPVMVGVVVAGLVRANDVTPVERVTAELGAADLGVELHPSGPEPLTVDDTDLATMAGLVDEVDADRSLPYRTSGWYQTGAELLDGARVTDLPLDDPLADGMYQVMAGRAPQAVDEIALSEELLEHHTLSLGDTIELDGAGELTIVGAFIEPTNVRTRVAAVMPAALDRLLDGYEVDAVPQWLLGGLADSGAAEQDLYAAYDQATGLSEAQERVVARDEMQEAGVEVAATPESETLPAQPSLASRANLLRTYEMSPTGLDRMMTPQVIATLVAAVLLAEVALIAGAAYATGARRRLRELGLLGANGATTAHVRGAVVGEATVTGIVGAVAGIGAGLALLRFGRPLMQRFLAPLLTRLELSTTDLLGPAVVAILAVTIAAWLPARTAARVPTTTALEGRMPLSAPKRWIVPAGTGLAGFGALLLLAGILAAGSVGGVVAAMGVLLAIAGTALLTVPMIAGIGRIADRFPATLRLVLRDSGRQRTRAAAASASAMVVLIAPVLIATISLSMQHRDLVHGLPAADNHVLLPPTEQMLAGTDPATVDLDAIAADRDASLAAIAAVLPDAARADVRILDERASVAPDPRFTTSPPEEHEDPAAAGELGPDQQRNAEEELWYGWDQTDTNLAEATDGLLAALGDPAITRAVDDGQLVVLGLEARDTTVTIAGQQRPAVEVPAHVLRRGFPRVLVPPASTAELGLEVAGTADLFVTPEPITGAKRDALYQTVNTGDLPIGTVGPGNGPWLRWTAVAATLAIALMILALVTMLSATESDHDLRTMVAVGAPPRMRRRFLGLQSAIHALVGAILAVPLAIALAWAASRAEADFVTQGLFGAVSARAMWLDWPTIAAVLLGVPLAIGLAIALVVRSAATVPPHRTG
jgi:putative ABC transport system permease protein